MHIDVEPGNAAISVDLGKGGSIVTNNGPGTLIYSGSTLSSASSVTLFGVQQFSVTTQRASLQIVATDIGVITLDHGPSVFVGSIDPANGVAEGDVWIDTSGV